MEQRITIPILNLVSLIWLFAACPIFGQVVKKRSLTEGDYALWSHLTREQISDHGNWVSYNIGYESGNDTLFVKQLKNGKRYSFPGGFEENFDRERVFVCRLPNDSISVLNLATGKKTNRKATRFAFAGNRYIIAFNELTGTLSIDDSNSIQKFVMQGVTDFIASPNGKEIAVTSLAEGNGKVTILVTKTTITATVIAEQPNCSFSGLTWSSDSTKLLFFEKPDDTADEVIWLHDGTTKSNVKLDTKDADLWPENIFISDKSLLISGDGQRVFIAVKQRNTTDTEKSIGVEVWNSLDRDLFITRTPRKSSKKGYLIWEPYSKKTTIVGMEEEGVRVLNGDQRFAVSYDTNPYKPSHKFSPDSDYYLTRLADGKKSLLISAQPADYQTISASPDGKYFLYFREGNWWAYNCITEKYLNLTAAIGVAFADTSHDRPEAPPVFGIGGWAMSNDSVLLYDAFDIWQVYFDERNATRHTKGREVGVVYRIVETDERKLSKTGITSVLPKIDLSKLVVLTMLSTDKTKSGIGVLENGRTRHLYFESKAVSGIRKSTFSDKLIFTVQGFDHPPAILFTDTKGKRQKAIFRSNPQHDRYQWGRSERIMYKTAELTNGSATLFYPADYDNTKSYPMLVYVYEDLSVTLNNYKNPSLCNESGYNVTNYTQNGYVVLHPNISYEIGKTGVSALRHILGAVDASLRQASIDSTKIGLIGHSFGGYETLFTITQTNRFAAAVAGAGISDLVYMNHTLGMNLKKPDSWRLEFQQFRMGKPFFQNIEGYLENSPILYADKVNTPLLTWTGLKDEVTGPIQTMEFYLALRRSGKEHIMLRYPKGMHSLYERDDMKDLTIRIKQWFDHKLRGKPAPSWLSPL